MSGRMVASQPIILRYLREHPDSTAHQISEHTDLSYSTVKRNLNKMVEDGIVTISGTVYNKGLPVRTFGVVS